MVIQSVPASAASRSIQESGSISSSTCPSIPKPQPFDPFVDLRFEERLGQDVEDDDSSYYSSFHCVGTGSRKSILQTDAATNLRARRPNFVSRTCHYRNLYYKIADQSFHYFASPSEQAALTAHNASDIQFEFGEDPNALLTRMEVSLGHSDELIFPMFLERNEIVPWKPEIRYENDMENDKAGDNDSRSREWVSKRRRDTKVASITTPKSDDGISIRPAFLLYQPYHSYNLGHLIWDDLLSLFSMLDLFDLVARTTGTLVASTNPPTYRLQPVPLFVEMSNPDANENFGSPDRQWRCSPANVDKWRGCAKAYSRFLAPLFGIQPDHCSGDLLRTSNWLRGEGTIGVWQEHAKQLECVVAGENGEIDISTENRRNSLAGSPETEYILLPHALVGTGRLNFYGCSGDCTVGRGPQYYRFRNYMLDHLFGPSEHCRKHQAEVQQPVTALKGYITFSLPIGSSRPDEVTFFEAEIAWAKSKYGKERVRAVDMATLSMLEQAELIRNSALFLTNHGGGGSISIFLPQGAGVMVFWHSTHRFDHNFYESVGYFRITWVSVSERQHVPRTTALMEHELERTATEWSQS